VNEELTDRQRRYVENISSGMTPRATATSAGFSESYAKVAAHRLGKKPAVAQAIASIRSEGRTMAVYDLATAMREADDVCAFAKQHKNAMAYCKATELRAKLSGLLIDTIKIVQVDLVGALAAAERRVIDVTPLGAQRLEGPARWIPRIPGDEKPEAGPTDGQVGS
jgi:hypothetical protein